MGGGHVLATLLTHTHSHARLHGSGVMGGTAAGQDMRDIGEAEQQDENSGWSQIDDRSMGTDEAGEF